ncbi:MAG: hypothetical protein KBB39_02020 [Phycicoccus sp.]|nr:hypothetical protein [Phycicoccus sp.]
MSALDALGWFGSALLIFSVLQTRILRLRILSAIASVILTIFNGIIGVWPMVAMNIALAAINIYFIVQILRERRQGGAYTVLQVGDTDAYLQHFLATEREDIATFFPQFGGLAESPERTAYLIQHGNETAGVVIVRDTGDHIARVELDYVTPAYRDFAPGEYVFRESDMLRDKGFRSVQTPAGMVDPYYGRIGFTREGDHWILALA